MSYVQNKQSLSNYAIYFIFSLFSSHFVFQSVVNPERISGDIIESLRDDHRSGRSLDSLDKTLDDFCADSTFSVRKTAIPCSLC